MFAMHKGAFAVGMRIVVVPQLRCNCKGASSGHKHRSTGGNGKIHITTDLLTSALRNVEASYGLLTVAIDVMYLKGNRHVAESNSSHGIAYRYRRF